MVLNATFNNISVIYRGGHLYFYPKYPEKTTVIDKTLCTSPWSRFELTTSVVIDTHSIVVNPTTIWSRPRRPLFYQ